MNNNVKIYHITLNTKNIKLTNQTQIAKEESRRDNNKAKAKLNLTWIHTQIEYKTLTH